MKILNSKKTGCSMKHRKSIIVCFAAFAYLIFCGHACSPADDLVGECGLYLNVDLPKGADSVHVKICNQDSVCHVFNDLKSCSKCYEKDHKWIGLFEGNADLKMKFGWGKGEYFMEETAFCKGEKVVFPSVAFSLKNGMANNISVKYVQSEIGYQPFLQEKNPCNIDSLYKIRTISNSNCIE